MSEDVKDQENLYDGLDIKVISGLIHAMNMAGSKLTAYPEGHPFIIESFQKVENILQNIFETRSQLSFGIAKNSVMMGMKLLDQKNPIFQRFAGTLFEQGIVKFTVLRGLTSKELMDFDIIVSQKRNDIYRKGGVEFLISKAGIRHIHLELIDYTLFRAEEDLEIGERDGENLQSLSFWETFVRGLFEGTLDPDARGGRPWDEIDPKALAEMLNNAYFNRDSQALDGLDLTLLASIQRNGLTALMDNDESKERLFTFIDSLNENLRRCFLERFLNSIPNNNEIANAILSGLSNEIILDALKKQANEEFYIPPNVLKILQKIKKTPEGVDLDGIDRFVEEHPKERLAEKLNVIFKEDENDQFIPLDYQKVLQDIIVAEDFSTIELSEVHHLGQTLNDYSIQMSLTSIIVNLVIVHSDGQVSDFLKKVFKDHCLLLVKNGDFHVISGILDTLITRIDNSGKGKEFYLNELMEMYTERNFMENVLTAATHWGKEKHFFIKKIIKQIGEPFIEPLLDRLTEEESKTLRLFYLDLLKEFGGAVKNQVIRRLGDKRWYVVRNLLFVLRQLNDPSVLNSIYGLFNHHDQRVRFELLQTFLALKDPRADKILLKEMDSGDTDRCLKAIALAGMTRNSDVFDVIVGFIKKRRLNKIDLEIKKASVRALADVGDPSFLPVLQAVLKSFSLFSYSRLKLLKLETLASLGRFPPQEVFPLLQKIARSRSGEMAHKAAQVIKTLKAERS